MSIVDIIRTEITNDPLVKGYLGMTDQQVADSLNAKTRTNGAQSIDVPTLVASIARADWDTLVAADKNYLSFICGQPTLPLIQPLKAQLGALFPAGSATRNKLLAMQDRAISRAEELGITVQVGDGHVASARS